MEKKLGVSMSTIRMLSFNVNEDLFQKGSNEMATNLTMSRWTADTKQSIKIRIKASVRYLGAADEDILSSIEVETLYALTNAESDKDGIIFPEQVAVNIASLSVSNIRGMWCLLLGRTKYEHYIMPILDGVNVAKQIFPNSFPEEKKE